MSGYGTGAPGRARVVWHGPAVAAGLAAALAAFSVYVARVPDPGVVMMLGVVYAALVGGGATGVAAVAACAAVAGGLASVPPFSAAFPDAYVRLPIFLVTALVVVWGIASLQRRALAAEARRAAGEEEVFRAVTNGLHDAVLVCDWRGVQDVNASFCAMTGFTRDELIGAAPPFPFWPAEEYGRIATALEKAMCGQALDFELVLVRKSGDRFPVLLSVSRLVDGPAGENRIVYTFRDISERVNAERAARAADVRLRSALAVANLGTWEIDLATDRVTGADRLWEIFGVTAAEAAANPAAAWDRVHPDDRARVRAAVAAAAAGAGPYHAEFRVVHPDGRVAWLYGHGIVLRDAAGKPTHLIGATMDVTPLLEAREELRIVRHQLESAMGAANLGTWEWDLVTGKITWHGHHDRLMGLPPGVFDGKYETYRARVHPDDIAGVEARIEAARQSRGEYRHRYRAVWPDGSVHWVLGVGRFVYSDAGEAVRMYGILLGSDGSDTGGNGGTAE